MAWLSKYEPQLLSVLRIIAGLLFLEHGTQKLLHFPPMTMAIPPSFLPVIMTAAAIELVGGVLITLGLFTRIAAFICAGEMAFAYFLGHAPRNFFPAVNMGDAAILFCFIFLFIAAAGPGPWAVSRSTKL
jgi:putative oxidoreductase